MRFDQQKSACSRAARLVALVWLLSASGSQVFAFGQAQAPVVAQPQIPATPPVVTPEPAPQGEPRRSLPARTPGRARFGSRRTRPSDGAREQPGHSRRAAEPADRDLRAWRRRARFSRRTWSRQTATRSSTHAARNFLTGGDNLTNDSCQHQRGHAAADPVGRRGLQRRAGTRRSSRRATPRPTFNPQLDSGLSAPSRSRSPQLHRSISARERAPQQEPPADRGPGAPADRDPDHAGGAQLRTSTW